MCRIAITAILAASVGTLGSTQWSSAQGVDLQLLLAVDVSPSVDADEYVLQIHGIASALRHPDVIDAISRAAPNGVAVALLQWAGPREQLLSVPWSVVRDQATANALATEIETVVRPVTNGGTAIGDALARGVNLLAEGGFQAKRQVIDISGDGSTNIGDSPAPVRARAVSLGITVNGLVILTDEQQLDAYYVKRVAGGPGAFVLHIQSFADFALGMRLKLIREIEMSMSTDVSPARRTDVALLELVAEQHHGCHPQSQPRAPQRARGMTELANFQTFGVDTAKSRRGSRLSLQALQRKDGNGSILPVPICPGRVECGSQATDVQLTDARRGAAERGHVGHRSAECCRA
nr:DUF1194 domain-containing protein [Ensifer sp. IC4062]